MQYPSPYAVIYRQPGTRFCNRSPVYSFAHPLSGGKDKTMKFDKKGTGERIRKLRKEKGLKQEALAEQLHVSTRYLGKLERGDQCISVTLVVEVAAYFHVTLDYLLLGMTDYRLEIKANLSQSIALLSEYVDRL